VRAQLNEDSLVRANAQFWEQMLAMRLDPEPSRESFSVAEEHLLASVSLSGMWTGRVEVRLARGLAFAATAAMLMQPEDAVSEADVMDAIREIANMIGGVLKSSLPRPCAMTLPVSSVSGEDHSEKSQDGEELAVAFRHPAGGLMLRVWEEKCGS